MAEPLSGELSEIVKALGTMALDQTKSFGAQEVRVVVAPNTRETHLTVLLEELPTDERVEALMRALVGVRSFYLDELSISFEIALRDEPLRQTFDDEDSTQQLAFATN